MNTTTLNEQLEIEEEEVVQLGRDLAGVQAPDGRFVPRQRLGPGVIRQVGHEPRNELSGTPEGAEEILVHWAAADFDVWMQPDEVECFDPASRLIATYERDGREGSGG